MLGKHSSSKSGLTLSGRAFYLSVLCALTMGFLFIPEHALAQNSFDDDAIVDAICDLFRMSSGSFGALFALAAGVGTVVAAAFGMYRTAISFLVVAIAFFILPSYISLSFGWFDCDGHGSFMTTANAKDDIMIRREICDRLELIEGAGGALVMTIAGIVAIVSAAIGAWRAGYTLAIVGILAFITRALLSLYFGQFDCGQINRDANAIMEDFFNSSNSGGEEEMPEDEV